VYVVKPTLKEKPEGKSKSAVELYEAPKLATVAPVISSRETVSFNNGKDVDVHTVFWLKRFVPITIPISAPVILFTHKF
jgi:hypothetical protein